MNSVRVIDSPLGFPDPWVGDEGWEEDCIVVLCMEFEESEGECEFGARMAP